MILFTKSCVLGIGEKNPKRKKSDCRILPHACFSIHSLTRKGLSSVSNLTKLTNKISNAINYRTNNKYKMTIRAIVPYIVNFFSFSLYSYSLFTHLFLLFIRLLLWVQRISFNLCPCVFNWLVSQWGDNSFISGTTILDFIYHTDSSKLFFNIWGAYQKCIIYHQNFLFNFWSSCGGFTIFVVFVL